MSLSEDDQGNEIHIQGVSVLEFSFVETSSTGYVWGLISILPKQIQFIGKEYHAATDDTGGSGTRKFRYKLISLVDTNMSFALKRKWEPISAATKIVTYRLVP